MTKKEAIIQYFRTMDIGMLALVLDEDRTYQDADKTVFLEKLHNVFEQFCAAGDRSLIAHEGQCEGETCNKGRKGFSFEGEVSGKRLDLVFEENQTDYTDIYYCHCFRSVKDAGEFPDKLSISIGTDEKKNFVRTLDYLLQQNNCAAAVAELRQYAGTIISKDVYTAWYAKYEALHDTLPNLFKGYRGFDPFPYIMFDLKEILEIAELEERAQQAMEEHDRLDGSVESLLAWMVEYEETGSSVPLFLLAPKMYGDKEVIEFPRIKDVLIDVNDFRHFISLRNVYGIYFQMVKLKYGLFPANVFPKEDEDPGEYYSLSSQLRKRGII